ncbi:MAG TPA: ferredoxin reductase [Nocardioidaceae bacterium]|nr:ferredoxin reductase [Nocardioidaceae bacterium]
MSLSLSISNSAPRVSRSSGPGALTTRLLRSRAVAALVSPHPVDRYLEIVNPMWAVEEVRARVEGVRRETDGARDGGPVTTLTLRPTRTWRGFRAGQFVQVGVEIDGARRTRCFSISSSEQVGGETVTITVRAHEEGLVSKYLATRAEPGTVVHLSQADGAFTLPDELPDRVLMISGGSGITPVMSMLRTLVDREYDGRITFVHYARDPESTIFREELERLSGHDNIDLTVVHTRAGGARFTAQTLADLVPGHREIATFACGPAGLVERVREAYGDSELLRVEYFKTSTIAADAENAGGSVSFARAGKAAENTGATLLEQAESLGLTPEHGCRMGICFSCTSRKTEGTVRNVVTGATSSLPDEDIQICVSQPVGDCVVDL